MRDELEAEPAGGDERATRLAVEMIGLIESLLELRRGRLQRVAHLFRSA